MALSNSFVHHVYFWLKNPGSTEDRAALTAGLQGLTTIGTIKESHIGRPAGTSRDVIDASYALSWLALFATAEDQDSYQTDPIHLQFVKECAHLWSKVVVYDSIGL
jgi:Stress responsive A/B Barrel Domain